MSAPTQTPDRRGEWIQTYTLRQFWPLDPRPEDVCLEDIAHALSMQCRFTGHVTEFYSVAEHCVRVSRLAEEIAADAWLRRGETLGAGESLYPGGIGERLAHIARWGLLHDASEAYLVDVARPVKRSVAMAPYRQAEQRVQQCILERFGLPLEEPPEVVLADRRLCATEARDLFRGLHPEWRNPVEPLPERIRPWTHREAEEAFLTRFRLLFPNGGAQ